MINRSKRTTRRNIKVTVWSVPHSQWLVCEGRQSDGRAAAIRLFGTSKGLRGQTEYWSNSEISALPEYEE